ncbi:oligosaccharide flippase family protein [Patescibacteria group bacterium]|nr:oligosaccharide flippase family protein [Patescibacteria group bacterium]
MPLDHTYNFFKQSVKGGFFYSSLGVLVKILVVVNVFFILRYLSIYEYGVYKLAFSLYVIGSGLLLSGLDGIVLNDVSNYLARKNRPSIKRLLFEFSGVRILLGILAWAVVFFGAQLIAVYYNAQVADYLKILSFLYLSDSLITIFDIVFKATLNFARSALIPVLNELNKFFIIIYFLLLTKGLTIQQVLWASVSATFITTGILLIYFIFKYKSSITIPKDDKYILFKTIRTYGKWAIAKSYFVNFAKNIRLWLIKIFISTEAVAIFSVAESLYANVKKIIPMQALATIIPRQLGQYDLSKFTDIYKRSAKYFLFLFTGVGLVSYFIAPIAVKIFFPKYIVSLPFFQLYLLLLLINVFALTKLTIYTMRRMKFLFLEPFIRMISVVVLGTILISNFKIWGAVIEAMLTNAIFVIIMYFYLIKQLPQLKLSLKDIFYFDIQDKMIIKMLYSNFKTYFRKKLNLLFKGRHV